MSRCTVCRRLCIPLADYAQPCCIECDDDMDRVLAEARRRFDQPREQLAPCGTHAAFNRHKKRGEPVDDHCREGERAYQREKKRADRAKARAA